MSRIRLISAIILLLAASGCNGHEKASAPFDWEKSELGHSASCAVPPDVFQWAGSEYKLVQLDPTAEPGMKFGFVQCVGGSFTMGDGGPGTLIVYSNGDPRTNNDLMLFGAWGRTLYTKRT